MNRSNKRRAADDGDRVDDKRPRNFTSNGGPPRRGGRDNRNRRDSGRPAGDQYRPGRQGGQRSNGRQPEHYWPGDQRGEGNRQPPSDHYRPGPRCANDREHRPRQGDGYGATEGRVVLDYGDGHVDEPTPRVDNHERRGQPAPKETSRGQHAIAQQINRPTNGETKATEPRVNEPKKEVIRTVIKQEAKPAQRVKQEAKTTQTIKQEAPQVKKETEPDTSKDKNRPEGRPANRFGDANYKKPKFINAGDSGIWVTCPRGRESKCVVDALEIFYKNAKLLYPQHFGNLEGSHNGAGDITSQIQKEVSNLEINQQDKWKLFVPIMFHQSCVVFFRIEEPIDPVALVKFVCEQAAANPQQRSSSAVQKMVPITEMAESTEYELEKLCDKVLAKDFPASPTTLHKYAIKPMHRNHNFLKREKIIEIVADCTGPGHTVDLKNYDRLILVQCFKHVVGMSVVDESYRRLKEYNLDQIFHPEEKPAEKDQEAEEGEIVSPKAAAKRNCKKDKRKGKKQGQEEASKNDQKDVQKESQEEANKGKLPGAMELD